MILTVTANPALDITYDVAALRPGQVHRVRTVTEHAGGKGVNVARVLDQLGEPVVAAGFLGGPDGARVRELLEATGVRQAWVEVPVTTRRSVAVVHDGEATVLNEPGRPVGPAPWRRLTALLAEELGTGDVVTINGSVPAGTAPEELRALVETVVAAGARVVVDTSGPLLLEAAAAGAHLLKPNDEELLAATGAGDVLAGAICLLERGAEAVVVSCGAEGMVAVARSAGTAAGTAGTTALAWRSRPAEVVRGNPTGAGDAAVAALARSLAHHPGEPLVTVLPGALPDAVALSGAAVLRPVAGEVDLPAYRRMRALITVEELHVPR